jgi:hypothetical protein
MTAVAITGHTSFETAHETADYPYGYSARTQRREWIEYKPKFGYRFVTCTRNPKTGKWNKPKPGGYYELAVMTLDPENEHVNYAALGYHDRAEVIDRFEERYGHTFGDRERDIIKWLRAARLAESKVTYTITRGPTYAMNSETGQLQKISDGDADDQPRQTLEEQAQMMHNLTAAAYAGKLS